MDARLSHALVAAGAVALTVVGYTIVDGVASTVRGLAGDGSSRSARVEDVDHARNEADRADKDKDKDKGDKDKGDKGKGDKEPTEGAPVEPGAERPDGEGGQGRIAQRAEEMGVDARDLREQKAAEQGMTLDQYKKRRQSRADWRSQQDPELLAARRDARQERKAIADMTPEEIAELEALRELRQDVGDLDPSLKDAAGVLKQLRQVGDGFDDGGEEPPLEEEPLE